MGKWLELMVTMAVVLCALAQVTDAVQNRDQGRWRWSESAAASSRPAGRKTASREGAGRHIPNRPTLHIHTTQKPNVKITGTRLKNPVRFAPSIGPKIVSTTTTTEPPTTTATTPTTTTKKSVPLLKDAGKPGNPYALLNSIFPPEDFIRTEEEERASLISLRGKDLGGLDASEVYVADDDLFVVRGFNYKKPYTADPAGPPISDYEAPKPLPPPIPEPGTVFYPKNPDDSEDLSAFLPDEVNGIFNPFYESELPGNNSIPPQLPYPFLPPPPPHWDSEIEFDNEIPDPFEMFDPSLLPTPINDNRPPQPELPAVQGDRPPPGIPGSPPFVPLFPSSPLPPPRPQGEQVAPPQDPQAPEQRQSPPPPPPPSATNQTFVDYDEDIAFTPLFPDRPVDYYYPTHNTTEVPPGPAGPGVFVPPPEGFFADRNESAVLAAPIPSFLLKPPFNIPNYFIKSDDRRRKQQRPQQPVSPSLPEADIPMQYLPPSAVDHIESIPHVSTSTAAPTTSPLVKLVLSPGAELTHLNQPARPIKTHDHHYTEPKRINVHHIIHAVPTARPHRFHNINNYKYPISLETDTAVNFKPERPPINPDSELVDVALQQQQLHPPVPVTKATNYVSVYRHGTGGYSYQLTS